MLAPLIAYDADGNVIATLDHMVARDDDGRVVGLIDFAAVEAIGMALTDVWQVTDAAGSGTWPAWLGARAHDFAVELEPGWSRSQARGSRPEHRIAAMVHRASGHRHERAALEQAIAARIAAAGEAPADLRDLVGGPDRPLRLDDEGRVLGRSLASGTPRALMPRRMDPQS